MIALSDAAWLDLAPWLAGLGFMCFVLVVGVIVAVLVGIFRGDVV